MRYKNLYNLEPGDRLVEPLFQTGFSMHHAIYLGQDRFGNELIAENHKVMGVRIVDAKSFFSTVKCLDRIIKFSGSPSDRALAVKRALSLKGRKYDLINYNCEHYANEVQLGVATSSQTKNAFLMSLGAILLIFYNLDWK